MMSPTVATLLNHQGFNLGDVPGTALEHAGVGSHDIAAAASPSGVALETVAGLAGGAAVVAGAGALAADRFVAVPVLVVAGAAALVGYGAARGASWAYEKIIPQATRGMIDEGLRDARSAVGGFFKKLGGG